MPPKVGIVWVGIMGNAPSVLRTEETESLTLTPSPEPEHWTHGPPLAAHLFPKFIMVCFCLTQTFADSPWLSECGNINPTRRVGDPPGLNFYLRSGTACSTSGSVLL